jgi:polar amino acid transport system substrate-binding protein
MHVPTLVLAAVLGAVLALVLFSVFFRSPSSNQVVGAQYGSSYERVLASGKIRAGYVAYPPQSIVTPGSKDVTGIFPDILREIGKTTDLDVEFVEEAGWATLIEGLNSGKYDIVGGVWANPNRGKMATISRPVYFSGIGVWVRANETRFSSGGNWATINDPKVRIAAIDGSTPLGIAKKQFSRAALVTYPNLTSESQLFLDLKQGKIDIFFAEPAQGLAFLKANPGTIKNIAAQQPLKVFGNVFLMRRDEAQFKIFIDTALDDLESSGETARIVSRYQPDAATYFAKPLPYVTAR